MSVRKLRSSLVQQRASASASRRILSHELRGAHASSRSVRALMVRHTSSHASARNKRRESTIIHHPSLRHAVGIKTNNVRLDLADAEENAIIAKRRDERAALIKEARQERLAAEKKRSSMKEARSQELAAKSRARRSKIKGSMDARSRADTVGVVVNLSQLEKEWRKVRRSFETKMSRIRHKKGKKKGKYSYDHKSYFARITGTDSLLSGDEFRAAAKRSGIDAKVSRRVFKAMISMAPENSQDGQLTAAGFACLFKEQAERRASQIKAAELERVASMVKREEKHRMAEAAKQRQILMEQIKNEEVIIEEVHLSRFEIAFRDTGRTFEKKMSRKNNGGFDYESYFDRINGPSETLAKYEFVAAAQKCGTEVTEEALGDVFDFIIDEHPAHHEDGEMTLAGFAQLFNTSKQRRETQILAAAREKAEDLAEAERKRKREKERRDAMARRHREGGDRRKRGAYQSMALFGNAHLAQRTETGMPGGQKRGSFGLRGALHDFRSNLLGTKLSPTNENKVATLAPPMPPSRMKERSGSGHSVGRRPGSTRRRSARKRTGESFLSDVRNDARKGLLGGGGRMDFEKFL